MTAVLSSLDSIVRRHRVTYIGDPGRCFACRESIDPVGPAVSAPPDATWHPFVEEIRLTQVQLLHTACFVRDFGLDALIAAVHREDLRRTGRLRWT